MGPTVSAERRVLDRPLWRDVFVWWALVVAGGTVWWMVDRHGTPAPTDLLDIGMAVTLNEFVWVVVPALIRYEWRRQRRTTGGRSPRS